MKKIISRAILKIKKSLKNPKKIKRIIFFSVLLGVGLWIFWGIPLPTNLSSEEFPVSTKLFDRNGNLIYEIYTEKRRTPIKLSDLPPYIREATIAIEDKDFYKHRGFSPTGIVRAAFNIIVFRKLQGGSTITQQVVKNVLLTNEKKISRKLKEWVLSLKLEKVMTKEQILSVYLNEIPYGGTIYGVEEASEAFFNKKASEVSLAQAAYLAAIPKAPTFYSPYGQNKAKLDERKNLVLQKMLENKFVTEEEYGTAKKEMVEKLSGFSSLNKILKNLPRVRYKILAARIHPHYKPTPYQT